MATVTIYIDFGAQKNSLSLFPHLFAMKWWDQMPWLRWHLNLNKIASLFWMLSFKPTFTLSSFTFIRRLFAAKSLQSCPTVCDPIDSSPPGFPIPGILQAWTLEWVAISFSSAWKWKVKVKSLSHVWLCATPWTAAYQAPPSMGFSRQEYWSGVPLPSPRRLFSSLLSAIRVVSSVYMRLLIFLR